MTIEDGTLKGFGTGISFGLLDGLTSSVVTDPTISDVTFTDGATGISGTESARITSNRFFNISATAVFLRGPGDFAQDSASVSGNTITGSGAGIVLAGSAATISGNVIRGNVEAAVSVSSTPDITIDHNTLSVTRLVCRSTPTLLTPAALAYVLCPHPTWSSRTTSWMPTAGWALYGPGQEGRAMRYRATSPTGKCTAGETAASGDGIEFDLTFEVEDVTVASNRADNNLGTGIDAPGVIDGGGNLASGNMGAAQCVGVVCESG